MCGKAYENSSIIMIILLPFSIVIVWIIRLLCQLIHHIFCLTLHSDITDPPIYSYHKMNELIKLTIFKSLACENAHLHISISPCSFEISSSFSAIVLVMFCFASVIFFNCTCNSRFIDARFSSLWNKYRLQYFTR